MNKETRKLLEYVEAAIESHITVLDEKYEGIDDAVNELQTDRKQATLRDALNEIHEALHPEDYTKGGE